MKLAHLCLAAMLLATIIACTWAVAADEPAAKSGIKGIVRFIVKDGDRVPAVTVSLDGPVQKDDVKTNDSGEFEFTELPPGEYKLEAKGIVKNKFRIGKATVTLSSPAKEPTSPIVIVLK